MIYRLINYIEAEKDRLIEKYGKIFEENPKLKDVDLSFTEHDQ